MPTHHLTTGFALGHVVTWAGEPGTRFVVNQILIGLRQGLGEVVTHGLHDPAQPRPWLIWAYEADCQIVDERGEAAWVTRWNCPSHSMRGIKAFLTRISRL